MSDSENKEVVDMIDDLSDDSDEEVVYENKFNTCMDQMINSVPVILSKINEGHNEKNEVFKNDMLTMLNNNISFLQNNMSQIPAENKSEFEGISDHMNTINDMINKVRALGK